MPFHLDLAARVERNGSNAVAWVEGIGNERENEIIAISVVYNSSILLTLVAISRGKLEAQGYPNTPT